jgi:TP901 family phage tail tape measure protein
MAVRTAQVIYVGDAASLIRAGEQAKASSTSTTATIVSSNDRISASAMAAGKAAQRSAEVFGASVEKQAQAAGEAAAQQARAADASEASQTASYNRAAGAAEAAALRHKNVGETVVKAGELAAGGLAITAAASIDLGMKSEKSAAMIQSASGVSAAAAKKLEDQFLATGGTAEDSGEKIGEAYAAVAGQLKTVEGRALTNSQAMKVMDAAMDLNTATGGELKSTTESLAKVMLVYGLNAGQASKASDILYNASSATGASIEEVAQAIDQMHGKLGAAAPDLKDTAGLLDEFAKQGIKGRQSTTALSGVFNTLLGGGKDVTAMSKELGLEVFTSTGKFVGLHSIITQLQPKLEKLAPQFQLEATKALFGATANKQLLDIIEQGPKAFEGAAAAASKAGTAHHAAAVQSADLEGEYRKLKATAEDVGGEFGEVLTPEVAKASHAFQDSIEWMKKHETEAKILAGVVGTVLGGALTVFAYSKAAKFVESTEDMIDGMGSLAKKIGISSGEVDTSYAGTATAAEVSAAKTAAAQDALAGDVATADGEIIASNEAAGGSFTAMLGPIALAAAAVAGLNSILPNGDKLQNLLGGNQPGESGKEGEAFGKKFTSGGALGGTTSQVEGEIFTELQKAKIPQTIIYGIIKALGAESGLKTNATGSEGAYGLAQWLGSRRTGLEHFAGETHQSGNAVSTQIQYLLKELGTSEHGTYEKLKGAKTAEQAEALFVKLFERPEASNIPAIMGRGKHYAGGIGGAHHAAKAKHGGGTGSLPSIEELTKKPESESEAFNSATDKIERHTAKEWAHIRAENALHKNGSSGTESAAQVDKWAESSIGKFAESWGKNTGPELDKLQKEFHTHAAAWCAEFATTAAMMGGANKAVRTASVATIREWAEQGSHGYKKGVSHDPTTGSLMMFGDSHVGFVQSVDKKAGTVQLIEGNANGSGGVVQRTRKITEGEYADPIYNKMKTGAVELKKMSKQYAEAVKQAEHLLLTAGQKAGLHSHVAAAGEDHATAAMYGGAAAEVGGFLEARQAKWALQKKDLTTPEGKKAATEQAEQAVLTEQTKKKYYERELRALQKEATEWGKIRDSYRKYARHVHGPGAKKEALKKAAEFDAKVKGAQNEAKELGGTIVSTETAILEAENTLNVTLPEEIAAAAEAAADKVTEGVAGDLSSYQAANSKIDLEERAGLLTPEQAKAAKEANANKALAGGFGALSEEGILQVKGDLLEFAKATQEATDALEAHTEALKESTKALNEFTQAGNGIAQVESGSLAKSLADTISGQIAGVNYQGRKLTAGAGTAARY